MSQYVIVYLGGNHPSSPEEGKQHMAKYMEWISSLGDAAVSPANPLKGYKHGKPRWYRDRRRDNINVGLYDN